MPNALIGHTGFVGGNLLRQSRFDSLYNSKNIEDIAGRSFDLIVCAGAPAEKWKANQDPVGDRKCLERLATAVSQAQAKQVILISTVDVYGQPISVTEDDPPTGATPYGAHRLWLEQILSERFSTLIVRLPGLFGSGLKKNVIYDLLNDNQVERIDSRDIYQFYGLSTLWRDIEIARNAKLPLVHFATEPVSVEEVARTAFGRAFQNEVVPTPACYDMRTCHADLYQGIAGYMQSKTQVLEAIREFVALEHPRDKKCV